MTKRRSISRLMRTRIFDRDGGRCCLCKLPINAPKDKWILEHLKPLWLGGADLKPKLFISNISIGDRRQVLQGDGHRNQLVAICITPEVAEKVVRAVNAHDDLVKALQTSLVAMSIAAGVADEYDFDPAIAECKATLSRLHSEG